MYGEANGVPYRVNRLTGVQQYPSDEGWIREGEVAERAEAKIAPEVARFGERVAELRRGVEGKTVRKIDVAGRQVSAYFADGRKAQYYAIDMEDPRLADVVGLRNRLLGISTDGE